MLSKKTWFILIATFLVSVFVRLPTLNRPLSKHHEFCTAISLRVMQIWNEKGIDSYHYSPVMNFQNRGDKFINNHTTGLKDKQGNFYYISHPPFAYILPYFIFKILHIKISILSLQIFNIIFHFFSAVIIYLIICLILKKNLRNQFSVSAFLGSVTYLFSPVTLWFHSNVYMSDMFVQNFWITGVFIMLKIIIEKRNSVLWTFLLGLLTFLMCLTEWLGYFFFSIALVLSFYKEKNLRASLAIATAGLSAFLITILLYSSIDGFENYIYAALDRFKTRSGYFSDIDFLFHFKTFFFNYATGYLPSIFLLCILLLKNKFSFSISKYFLIISLLPVLLHHFIFINYSGHDFAMLKTGLFISVSCGLYFEKINSHKIILIIILLLVSLAQYYYINRPGNFSLTGEPYNTYEKLGHFIKTNSNNDEVIFINHPDYIQPQVVFYAQRNIKDATDTADAKLFLMKYGNEKGIFFLFKKDNIISYYRFRISE